jgi:hypothetical protein
VESELLRAEGVAEQLGAIGPMRQIALTRADLGFRNST